MDDSDHLGKAIRESLEVLKATAIPRLPYRDPVNRQEKGKTDMIALKEGAETLGIPIFAIVTISEIIDFLHNREIDVGWYSTMR